jgi:pyridoxine kinase
VKPGIPEFMRDRAVPAADILTPNAFELGWLTGLPTESIEQAIAASRRLRGEGHAIVVATGVPAPHGEIATLAVHDDGVDVVTTPRIDVAVNGTGDSFAALFLARLLGARDVGALLRATAAARTRELELIAAQEMLVAPAPLYAATRHR